VQLDPLDVRLDQRVYGAFGAPRSADARRDCTTKLAGAAAMRDEARRFPEVDFAVVHPGVVNTDLGTTRGPLAWMMKLVKTQVGVSGRVRGAACSAARATALGTVARRRPLVLRGIEKAVAA
jgi:hypothetical protein